MALDALGERLQSPWVLETMEDFSKIYNSLFASLPSLHPKLPLECNYNIYLILVIITLKFVNYLCRGALVQWISGNWDEPKKMFDFKARPYFILKL